MALHWSFPERSQVRVEGRPRGDMSVWLES